MIHTLGDSHARCSFVGIPGVTGHELGPICMESVGKPRGKQSSSFMLDEIIASKNIQSSDLVILCFGEIDIRSKIQPRIEAGESEYGIIDELVTNFFITIQNSSHKNFWVFNVVPPISNSNRYYNPALPILGTDGERARWTRLMNVRLKEACREANILFLDVYDKYVNKDGMMTLKLACEEIHIGDTRFVKQELERMLYGRGR